jgi:hypothetical protein
LTRRTRQIWLASFVALHALLLVLFVTNLDVAADPKPPSDPEALAAWMAKHPADWLAASELTDSALDSAAPHRVALWRDSYALADYLAPRRPNSTAGFVRGGLFHWYELGAAERKAVLEAAVPLLRDPRTFEQLHAPLWQLTHDFAYLRRVVPNSISSLTLLRELAVSNGRFDEYRELRGAVRNARMQAFQQRRASSSMAELLELLPEHIDSGDEPLVKALLEELGRRSFQVQQIGGQVEELTLYAMRHNVQPLSALEPLIDTPGKLTNPTRARLALALGNRDAATRIETTTAITGAPEWIPYLVDRATFEERHGETAVATLYHTRAANSVAPATEQWTGTCSSGDLCHSAFRTHRGPLSVTLSVAQSDQTPPYVEIYLDGDLVAEGEVADQRTFTVHATEDPHRTEVRLVNRLTRNGTQRRLRVG